MSTPESRPNRIEHLNGKVGVLVHRVATRLGEWVLGVKSSGYPTELAVRTTASLLDRAGDRILVASGTLPSVFYTDPRLVVAMTRALERGVKLYLLAGEQVDPKSQRVIESLKGDVELYIRHEVPPTHFIVVDGRDVRMEELHNPRATYRTAYIWRNVLKDADALEEKFWSVVGEERSSA